MGQRWNLSRRGQTVDKLPGGESTEEKEMVKCDWVKDGFLEERDAPALLLSDPFLGMLYSFSKATALCEREDTNPTGRGVSHRALTPQSCR